VRRNLRQHLRCVADRQGAHPKLIQTRLGHWSITITLDTYSHMFPSVEAALAEQLDAVYEAAGNPDNVRELRKAE
jgi:integrase